MSLRYNVLPWTRENDNAEKLAAAKVRDLQDNLRFARQDAEWHRQALERQGKQLTAAHKLLTQERVYGEGQLSAANMRIGELLRERLAAAEVRETVELTLKVRILKLERQLELLGGEE